MKSVLGPDSPAGSILLKVSHQEANCVPLIASHLLANIREADLSRPFVLVCIGTDRSTGDSLGPLIGTRLEQSQLAGLHLFGTLDEPVHAMNLQETMSSIEERFHHPFVLAIDACLGQLASVGHIQLGMGPLKPGAGVNKDLPAVGHLHMTGIVNVGGFMEYFVLQNTRLSLVMKMADLMAQSIIQTLSYIDSSTPAWEPIRASAPFDR